MTILAGPLTRTGKLRRAETPLTLRDETDQLNERGQFVERGAACRAVAE